MTNRTTAALEQQLLGKSPIMISESANFFKLRHCASLGQVIEERGSSRSLRGIVTSFDSTSVTAMKLPFSTNSPLPSSFSLPKNDQLANFQPYSLGDPLVDLHCSLKSGSVFAFITQKKSADRLAAYRESQGDIVLRTQINSALTDSELFLHFLQLPHTALSQVKQGHSVTLILEDLHYYYLAFQRLQIESGGLPLSFTQALNGALNVAGGRLSVAAFVPSIEDYGSAVGQAADYVLRLNSDGDIELNSALNLPKKIGESAVAERILAEEVRQLLSAGKEMAKQIQFRRELKIYEDFWETEELNHFNTQVALIRKSRGDVLVVRAAMRYFFLKKELNEIEKFVRELPEYMKMHEPEVFEVAMKLGEFSDRDQVQEAFAKIDQALMKHRLAFQLAIPRL